MIIYQYIFYKFYRLFSFFGKMESTPEWKALILFSILICFNLITFFSLSETYLNIYILPQKQLNIIQKLLIAFGVISVLYFNYGLLIKKDKFLMINDKFSKQSKVLSFAGNLFVLGYALLSVYLLFQLN